MIRAAVVDIRIYRAALIPALLALVVAMFSVQDRPAPLTSTLAPDAFDAKGTFGTLRQVTAHPDRTPGSVGDALRVILQGASRPNRVLDFDLCDGGILVSTRAAFARRSFVHVYPCADLLKGQLSPEEQRHLDASVARYAHVAHRRDCLF